ncbi:hypothetical protein SNEBB_004875 [Seison nebaliae]|nr:hypothetical protein SNEBB_004875 [Seison nebaliae]
MIVISHIEIYFKKCCVNSERQKSGITSRLLSSCEFTNEVHDSLAPSQKCRNYLTAQIDLELRAFYTYLEMANNFKHSDIMYTGFGKYFDSESKEELAHADILMEYALTRGLDVILPSLKPLSGSIWRGPLEALNAALSLEKNVTKSLRLFVSECSDDAELSDILTSKLLHHQHEMIRELKGLIRRIQMSKSPTNELGEFLVDQELRRKFSIKEDL